MSSTILQNACQQMNSFYTTRLPLLEPRSSPDIKRPQPLTLIALPWTPHLIDKSAAQTNCHWVVIHVQWLQLQLWKEAANSQLMHAIDNLLTGNRATMCEWPLVIILFKPAPITTKVICCTIAICIANFFWLTNPKFISSLGSTWIPSAMVKAHDRASVICCDRLSVTTYNPFLTRPEQHYVCINVCKKQKNGN